MKSKTTVLRAALSLLMRGAFICVLAGLSAATAQAATIMWGPATNVVNDSDVSTNGVLQYAEHWGGTDGTVNGVAFTAAGTQVIKSGGSTATVSWAQGTLSTAYYGILRGVWYQATAGSTVTLNSLVPGQSYQVQLWSMDKRQPASAYQNISGGPSLKIVTGQYAIGFFTANAVTQVITNGTGSVGILNAVQVREVTLGPVDAGISTVTAIRISGEPDVKTARVTVTLRDSNALSVAGKTVMLTSSRGSADTISAASGPSSELGVVTFTVTTTMSGEAVFSAIAVADPDLAITQTAAVTFGTLVIGAQQFNAGDVLPSPIIAVSNDLLETSVSSVSGEIAGQAPRNGTTGTATENSTQNPAAYRLSAVTYNLNLTSNPRGYDITEIRLFSGWELGRAGQSYKISYALVEAPSTFIELVIVSALNSSKGSLLTRTYDSTGTRILRNVAALKFVMIDNGLAGSGTVFREFDVLGMATPPSGTMIRIF